MFNSVLNLKQLVTTYRFGVKRLIDRGYTFILRATSLWPTTTIIMLIVDDKEILWNHSFKSPKNTILQPVISWWPIYSCWGYSLMPFRDTKITRNETSVAHGNELLIGFVKLITLAYKHIYFVPNSSVLIRQNNNTVAISLFRIIFI